MPHTVYVEKEDCFHVVCDYSGSPRHAGLSHEAWKKEFDTDSAYRLMKETYPGATAGITPKGIGRWMKDWSNAIADMGCCR